MSFNRQGLQQEVFNTAYNDGFLSLVATGLHPGLRIFHRKGYMIGLLGNPIADDLRIDQSVLAFFESSSTHVEFAKRLNGSFMIIIYHEGRKELSIISDRFASLAFYYALDGENFRGAFSFIDLCELRRESKRSLTIKPEKVFEFIAMRRMFGDHTFEINSWYQSSATIITLTKEHQQPTPEKYWFPDYTSIAPTGRKLVHRICDVLRQSLSAHTSDIDDNDYGLFLSGGIDARAIIAASIRKPLCFTTCLTINNESRIASEVAAASGTSHHFISRPIDLYNGALDEAVKITGGMQSFMECQFLGYGSRLPKSVKMIMTGLMLDVFFAGLYLPKDPVNIFGRKGLHYKLRKLSNNIIKDFIYGVSYRLKTLDPFSLLCTSSKKNMYDCLYSSIEEVKLQGSALGATGYKLWEYFHIHNFSRHYSFPMMTSIRTWADCRSPGLENDIFDLSISMSGAQKVNSDAYLQAVTELDPMVMNILNANTNMTAGRSLKNQTWIKTISYLANKIFHTPYPKSPGRQDRSWPPIKDSLEAAADVTAAIKILSTSAQFDDLKIFNMDKLSKIVDEHISGRVDHSNALAILVTAQRSLTLSTGIQD